jgi:hypothetical protein
MSVNALRSHLAECGPVVAMGIGRIDELSELAESDACLPHTRRRPANRLGDRRQRP